ncbi:ATP-dependent DNA ligase [Burkholderia sp. OAS925]
MRALAEVAGVDHKRIAQRMVGWTDSRQKPDAARYLRLIAPEASELAGDDAQHPTERHDSDLGLPYPFFLAHPLQADPETLGDPSHWLIEWKWDGIRAQLVKRAGRVWLWSRGEDLITDRFPEVTALGEALPDGFVIDGEILAWEPGAIAPLPFARLQTAHRAQDADEKNSRRFARCIARLRSARSGRQRFAHDAARRTACASRRAGGIARHHACARSAARIAARIGRGLADVGCTA